MGIFIGIFCVAVFMDLRFYKIPNLCILAGMAVGLNMTYVSYSVEGALGACAAAGLIFMAFYPFYLAGGLGAGDVKLLMTAGCFAAGERLIQYLLVTFAAAAAIAAIKTMLFRESRERFLYLGRYLRKAALTGSVDNYVTDKTNKRCVIRLSVPALISLLMMCAGLY
ncbi:MAG: prepilin peptidase [Lachnospiraceae bacterium]|nr:prepilin peptidase [Lachnospiraceae bacterium]